eukprot:3634131-Rhodomonas_salina.2
MGMESEGRGRGTLWPAKHSTHLAASKPVVAGRPAAEVLDAVVEHDVRHQLRLVPGPTPHSLCDAQPSALPPRFLSPYLSPLPFTCLPVAPSLCLSLCLSLLLRLCLAVVARRVRACAQRGGALTCSTRAPPPGSAAPCSPPPPSAPFIHILRPAACLRPTTPAPRGGRQRMRER